MQIGLIGLQNTGKTTLFQTLMHHSGHETNVSKTEVNRGVVKIPDKRLDELTSLFKPQKKVNATLEILDIPGLTISDDGKVKITNDFLNKVKNNDALLHIVRQFENDSVPHPNENIDVLRDIEFLDTEFLLADMSLIEKRLEKLEKEVLKNKNEQILRELPLFKKLQAHIENELPLRQLTLEEHEKRTLSGYQFLTLKPMILGINFDENSKGKVDSLITEIKNRFAKNNPVVFPFFAQFEYELSQLPPEEAEVFIADFGISESTLEVILRTSYDLLGIHSFFTVGEDECRAWTILKNSTAQDAAGAIHSDFYNKFIRAEVVYFEDYLKHGSFPKCKEAGVWRLEGKEYIVKDGDILNIRHS